ncbi:MAG: TfuA-like protein [Pseudomonadota bacterium]
MNVVFLGPTLDRRTAATLCEADYRPPAQRGDIHQAVARDGARVIGLIDGYFEGAPSVWHKEILFALSEEVAVFGAASMGALRAAELSAFGMVGVGVVAKAYADGRLAPWDDPFEDDDEVAVVHGPEEIGFAASDAMVDIRATLAAAAAQDVLTLADAKAIAASAKQLFYKERLYDTVLARALQDGVPQTAVAALRAFLPTGRVQQKRADAMALLTRLTQGVDPVHQPFRFERTLLWQSHVEGAADTNEEAPWRSR